MSFSGTLHDNFLVIDVSSGGRFNEQKMFTHQERYGLDVLMGETHSLKYGPDDLGPAPCVVVSVAAFSHIVQKACP